jgi:hypothetical protein
MSFAADTATVEKAREFMFKDLQGGIADGQNFMVALAMLVYTEFWGRVQEGIPRGRGRVCFDAFFVKLGTCYEDLLKRKIDVYGEVRSGLVHAYLIERSANISMGMGSCGVEFGDQSVRR